MLVTIGTIRNNHSIKTINRKSFLFLFILDTVLFFIMFAFAGFNWYLAAKGVTTLEFWVGLGGDSPNMYNWALERKRDNLYLLFGTNNVIRVLSPSLRSLPLTGLEWAFLLHDLGYNQAGRKLKKEVDIENQEDRQD